MLVANRGEIACRVIRGIQELGGLAIAVHSDVDHDALHVHHADIAVELGGAAPADSYLSIDKILDAARRHRADAIHPGYGFLSENADFADACEAAGFVFVGPSGEMMRSLGSKRLAKEVAARAGVSGVPGFDGHDASNDELAAAAERIGFPLLIKASAGGGGRGMRLVERAEDFQEALAAGRREAVQAFGDASMLLEKFVHPARHIEVQILGDGRGGALALGERECSVQRRHQKLLEESPSPVVDDELRDRLETAAVAIASEVGYRNAGTVEFLLGPDGDFYFLEVNTRLQVEHPVTEFVTGLDLVHLQFALAKGLQLDQLLPEQRRSLRGHALEARICAEDPGSGFLPASGRLAVCDLPSGPGIRVDTGFVQGSQVPAHYDSLLCKVIVHAPNRRACLQRMESALKSSCWLGVPTNADFLRRVIAHDAFRAGELRTDFLDVFPEVFTSDPATGDDVWIAAALATQLAAQDRAASPTSQKAPSPWDELDGFRLGASS